MIRGTTPDYILRVKNQDLTNKTVFVTVAQNRTKVTMTGNELAIAIDNNDSVIAVRLTQPQTLSLKEGDAEIQVRFIDDQGKAQATNIATVTVSPVLLEKVIQYNGND